jgi:hypothetical protein
MMPESLKDIVFGYDRGAADGDMCALVFRRGGKLLGTLYGEAAETVYSALQQRAAGG